VCGIQLAGHRPASTRRWQSAPLPLIRCNRPTGYPIALRVESGRRDSCAAINRCRTLPRRFFDSVIIAPVAPPTLSVCAPAAQIRRSGLILQAPRKDDQRVELPCPKAAVAGIGNPAPRARHGRISPTQDAILDGLCAGSVGGCGLGILGPTIEATGPGCAPLVSALQRFEIGRGIGGADHSVTTASGAALRIL